MFPTRKFVHNLIKTSNILLRTRCSRFLSAEVEDKSNITNKTEEKLGGYAKAYTKFESFTEKAAEMQQTFASLLRNSKFIDLGDPEGKVVTGKIVHIIDDDLYIDFGWKFNCVCTRPKKNASNYVRGARVRLLIKDLELSSKFLGYDKDLTLLEADCALLGLSQERSQPPAS